MNKKVITIFFILLLVSSLTPVFSADNTTKNVTVDGVNFEVPQEYQDITAESDEYVYMLDSIFDFAIRSLNNDEYLVDDYGYALENAYSSEVVTIGSHDVYYVLKGLLDNPVSFAFFASGDKIFCISWEGDSITPEIENMIEKAPDSEYSSEELSNIFNNAETQYAQDLEDEKLEYEYQQQDAMVKELNKIATRHYHYTQFGPNGISFGSVH